MEILKFEIECKNPEYVIQAVNIATEEYVNVAKKFQVKKRLFSRKSYVYIELSSEDLASLGRCSMLVERVIRALSGQWVPREPDTFHNPHQKNPTE